MNNSLSTHSHEKTAKRAEKIWQDYGKPVGRDIEIWHEAERQIAADASITQLESESNNTYPHVIDARHSSASAEQIVAETAAESVVEYYISPAIPSRDAVNAALQKQDARAPKVSHSAPPKRAPAESGKPLWNKPHSS